MPAKKKARKQKKPVVTSYAPRRSPVRPVSALAAFTLFVILAVSLFDYHPDQIGFIDSIARHTDESSKANLAGRVGADFGFLSYSWFGLAGWLIPFSALWVSSVLVFRRAHMIKSLRPIFLVALLILSAALVNGLDRGWTQFFVGLGPDNYLPHGPGGVVGGFLFYQMLEPALGVVGGNAVLLATFAGILFYLIPDGPGQLWAALGRLWVRIKQKQADRKAAKAKRKEDKILEKEELKAAREQARLDHKKQLAAAKEAAKLEKEAARKAAKEFKKQRKAPDDEDTPIKGSKLLSKWNRPDLDGKEKVDDSFIAQDEEEELAPALPKASDAQKSLTRSGRSKKKGDALKIVTAEKVEKVSDAVPRKRGSYQFPTLDLLTPVPEEIKIAPEEYQEVRERLRQTLEDFGVKVELGEVHTGPVITRYDLHPAAGVRVEKIANLDKNIGMALRAESVRILAPVPGKGCVGVEVPNANPAAVYLREIIESKVWAQSKADIPIVLGKEVSGKPLVADLTRMPHLLIAGSTGSGKTVCINAIIASLVYHSTPEDVRFLMVDPKIVEMQVFNDLPHMMIPVVTDPKKVPAALKWLLAEMERRYQVFAKLGVRNISGFNAKILKDKEERERAREMESEMSPEERAALAQAGDMEDDGVEFEMPKEKLPYIVCIIDELADLMMVAPADIETCVARLAQLARAAGIHLIIATQRPSVNVITGVIKANLPSRISFKVASKVDSRTILDGGGADTLIGKGDMLFIPPGVHSIVRAQGAFVSDDEISGIVEYLKRNGPPQFVESVQAHIEASGEEGDGFLGGEDGELEDEMLPQAIDVLRTTKRASTSMLQRRLRIGYNRAARLMEILEDKEIVGPENGAQPREILVDLDSL